MSRPFLIAALVAALAFGAACGGGAQPPSEPSAAPAPPGGPTDLRGACPATVVLQQDWQPEAEYGALYQLVGPNPVVDTEAKKVSGPLVAGGLDTGVRVEVRTAVSDQPVPAQMALDPAITLGTVSSDQAVSASGDQPVVTLISTLTTSPQVIMWDPASHPGAATIQQAAASGAPVVTSGDVIPELLISRGVIRPEQKDTSYDGTPARFVADPRILQQGYATTEPYNYANEIRQWMRPVAYQRLADVGYSIYAEPLAVPANRLEGLRPCLQKLIPILQRAQVEYITNPGETNALMVDLVNRYQAGWTYSPGTAEYAVRQLREQGYVTNDPGSGVFGRMDPQRWAEIVATFGPILQRTGDLPPGPLPDPGTLYSNEFIDPTVTLPGS